MRFTQAHHAQVLEAVKKNNCDLCGYHVWEMQDTLFYLPEYNGSEGNNPGSTALPLISMACSNCGNTKLINAIQIGIVSKEGKLLPPITSKEKG